MHFCIQIIINAWIIAEVKNCDLEVSALELHLCYNVQFQTNAFEKGMRLLIPTSIS